MLAKLIAPQIGDIVDSFVKGEISKEEMNARIAETIANSAAKMHVADAEALASTFGAAMGAISKNRLMQFGWLAVLVSQLWTLFWYQWIVPFGQFMGWWFNYPSPGETLVWAYALVGGCIGLGPIVLRAGPAAAGGVIGKLRSLVGR